MFQIQENPILNTPKNHVSNPRKLYFKGSTNLLHGGITKNGKNRILTIF
jgi:hypothetical protein